MSEQSKKALRDLTFKGLSKRGLDSEEAINRVNEELLF